jgi:hypothetical protein
MNKQIEDKIRKQALNSSEIHDMIEDWAENVDMDEVRAFNAKYPIVDYINIIQPPKTCNNAPFDVSSLNKMRLRMNGKQCKDFPIGSIVEWNNDRTIKGVVEKSKDSTSTVTIKWSCYDTTMTYKLVDLVGYVSLVSLPKKDMPDFES